MKRRSKFLIIAAIVLGVVLGLYATLRWIAFSRLQDAILKELSSLEDVGVTITYKTIETNAWNRSLLIEGLQATLDEKDSACSISGSIGRFNASGISLLPLLTKRELHIDEIVVDSPRLRAKNNFRQRPQKDAGRFLKKVFVSSLRVNSASVELRDSTSCGKYLDISVNIESREAEVSGLDEGTPSLLTNGIDITDVHATLHHWLYDLTLAGIHYDHLKRSLVIDSLALRPLFGRAEFARRSGKQIDQFTCLLPRLTLTGMNLENSPAEFYAKRAEVGFNLSAFRDKRIPRKLRKPTELPVKFLQGLPFKVQLDSLIVSGSTVSYEEIAEKGEVPGKVTFESLRARVGNISNMSNEPAGMLADARFMNAGNLHAAFYFPVNDGKAYSAKGALTDFSMPSLNAMLRPVAKVEIESGTMKHLKFEFQYNEYRADGKVDMLYSDLKVNGLKKSGKSENVIVSFLMDIFVQKDLDANDKKDKREGTIEMYRNPQRGIFNYWWNSILSGIKSVYGVDKVTETNGKKKVGK